MLAIYSHSVYINSMPDNLFFLPFVKKEQLTRDAFTFYFKRNGTEHSFTPGQYYEITLDINNADERGNARVFTISSSPTNQEYITITTRIIQSSFKMKLNELQPGDMIQFGGPWDDLNFDERDTTPRVFIAGGIGVTPYHSIMQYVTDKNITTPMILFASWHTREEMVFDDFFRNANNHLENFAYVPTLTNEVLDKGQWDGELGQIDRQMMEKYVSDASKSKFYFSGPPAMVMALKQTVKEMGVIEDNLFSEDFEGYK